MRKKYIGVVIIVAVVFVHAMYAFAVPSNNVVEFDGKGAGKVFFNGTIHAEKGNKCAACHPGLFKFKKGAEAITMKDMGEGKFCGHCHDGIKAFSVKEEANCTKCHKK